MLSFLCLSNYKTLKYNIYLLRFKVITFYFISKIILPIFYF